MFWLFYQRATFSINLWILSRSPKEETSRSIESLFLWEFMEFEPNPVVWIPLMALSEDKFPLNWSFVFSISFLLGALIIRKDGHYHSWRVHIIITIEHDVLGVSRLDALVHNLLDVIKVCFVFDLFIHISAFTLIIRINFQSECSWIASTGTGHWP